MQLIDGKKIAERIKDEIVGEIMKLGARPNLAIILVGEREDSKLYVNLKEKQAKAVGIDTHLYRCDEDIAETELISLIDFLNGDDLIDGILLQLPLPSHLNADRAVERILPEKDVDGFHPKNLEKMLTSCNYDVQPPLIGVIEEIIKEINFECRGKSVAALVHSDIFGQTIKHFFECRDALVKIISVTDEKLKQSLRAADLVITAVGKPGIITGDDLKGGAVVIDIGISRLPDGRVVGDVDSESVKELDGFITPVPGGVGPITIAEAFRNTLRLHQKIKG